MLKCLVMDDDELVRDLVALCLEGIADCEMAENGLKGVEMFRTALSNDTPYRLIILDIMMPEMDGHDAAKEIRLIEKTHGISIDKGVDILVLSSLNTPADVIQAYLSSSAVAHLAKPLRPEKLLATLDKLGHLCNSATPAALG